MSGLGQKLQVEAEDIRPGDFTTRTGFRRVVDVSPVLESWGRGKKRVVDQLTGVRLDYASDEPATLPIGALDKDGQPVVFTVYRP